MDGSECEKHIQLEFLILTQIEFQMGNEIAQKKIVLYFQIEKLN